MAISFEKQLKSVQAYNSALRSLGESSRAFGSVISSAFEKVTENQKEAVNYTRELEISQERIGKLVGVQEEKQKSLTKLLEKQGTYYKNGLNYLKSWEQRLKVLEKQTDSIVKKMGFHLLGLGTKVLQKVGKQVNNIFSLKGALKLLKVGIGTAIGIFAGLVATVKSVGGLIYRHLSGAFKLVSNVVKTSSSLVVSFFRKIWDTITMGGGEIRQAVAEMAQAFGMFNRTAGQAMNFLQANRRDWYHMGLSISEATKYVIEYNKAYGHLLGFGREAKAFYVENIKMSRALGLEAEQSAKLSRSLQESSMTLKDFAFSLVGTFGPGGPLESMGVMIPEVARDIADSVDQLALMNDQNKKTFIAGAVWVRQYGFAIKDLSGMMDKFDTLSSAAENVSKLNQMFGVSINAMEMLVDTDPAARLEKVQQKLLQAGKSWESMDYFQRKSLSSMMGLNAEQAQLVFSGKQLGKSRKEIAKAMEEEDKRQANSQKRQAEVMSAILVQLRASRGIMGSIMPLFYRLWVAFGRVFKTFLWGARRGALDFVEGWAAGIRKLAASPVWKQMSKDWVVRWRNTMKNFGVEWGNLWAQIDMEKFGKDFYGTIDTAIDAIKQIISDLFPNWAKSAKQGAMTINDVIHGIAERLQGIIKWLGENGADIIKGIGRVASATFNVTKKVFQFFDKSNWGAAATVMKDLFGTITQDMALVLGYVDQTTGKMLHGFDPALMAAKGLQASYMFMRNIVIEINQWWKKNGDEVKNFFKSAFETAKPWLKVALQIGQQTGAIIKAIGTFLAKNPALIGIIASFKAASFVSKGLFGMSLGQIGGGLLGKARGAGVGVQQVYVTNAAQIGAAANAGKTLSNINKTDWTAEERAALPGARMESIKAHGRNVGNQFRTAGAGVLTGATRGLVGGAIGYGVGSLVGGSTGGAIGAGVGTGVGVGSMFGPLGAAIGGAVGALGGFIFSLGAAADAEREAARKAKVDKSIKEMSEFRIAVEKQTQKFIESKSAVELMNMAMQEAINKTDKEQRVLELQIDTSEKNMDLAIEQMKIDKAILQGKLAEEKDPIKKKAIRDSITTQQTEITRRQALIQTLKSSIEYQQSEIAIQQLKLAMDTADVNSQIAREKNIQEMADIDEQIIKAKEREAGLIRNFYDKLAAIDPEKMGQTWGELTNFPTDAMELLRATSAAGFDSIDEYKRARMGQARTGLAVELAGVGENLKSLGLAPEVLAGLTSEIENTITKVRSGDQFKPEEITNIVSGLYSSIQQQVDAATEAGKFYEMTNLMNERGKLEAKLSDYNLTIGQYKLEALAIEAKRSKIIADAAVSTAPDAQDIAKQALQALSLRTPPSIPSYAFGGLVKQATNALIGEAGPELVVPMRRGPVTNSPGTEAIVNDYLNRVNTNRGNEERTIVIPIQLDGRKIGAGMVRLAHRSV